MCAARPPDPAAMRFTALCADKSALPGWGNRWELHGHLAQAAEGSLPLLGVLSPWRELTEPDLTALQMVDGFLGRPPAMCWLQKYLQQSQ